jgi:hypothetical protein
MQLCQENISATKCILIESVEFNEIIVTSHNPSSVSRKLQPSFYGDLYKNEHDVTAKHKKHGFCDVY